MHLFTFTCDLIYCCNLLIIFIDISCINRGKLLNKNPKSQKFIKDIKISKKNKLLI